MTHCSHGPLETHDTMSGVLDVLSQAAAGRAVAADRRIVAAPDSFDADEGLALLGAYVAIAERSVRQAVLDIVLAVGEADPDRRTRIETPAVGHVPGHAR